MHTIHPRNNNFCVRCLRQRWIASGENEEQDVAGDEECEQRRIQLAHIFDAVAAELDNLKAKLAAMSWVAVSVRHDLSNATRVLY